MSPDRQRRPVWAKKKVKYPEILELLKALIEKHKAGSPTEEDVYCVSLKPWHMFYK